VPTSPAQGRVVIQLEKKVGWLYKKSGILNSAYQKRYFVPQDGILARYSSELTSEDKKRQNGWISCCGLEIERDNGEIDKERAYFTTKALVAMHVSPQHGSYCSVCVVSARPDACLLLRAKRACSSKPSCPVSAVSRRPARVGGLSLAASHPRCVQQECDSTEDARMRPRLFIAKITELNLVFFSSRLDAVPAIWTLVTFAHIHISRPITQNCDGLEMEKLEVYWLNVQPNVPNNKNVVGKSVTPTTCQNQAYRHT